MFQRPPLRRTRSTIRSLTAWTALVVLFIAAAPAFAATAPNDEEASFFMQLMQNLLQFDSSGLMKTLGKPEFAIAAFIAINLIVFTETGLLIGFFLPGDSLLVTAGLIASSPYCGWSLPLLLVTVCVSAVLGDSVGYGIGYKTGPKIFCREKSFFFNKDHLLKAQTFYERHGGKTIILARFMPILRTFAPVVAGVGKMEYRRFLFYNIFGGVGWVCSMILCGYFLPSLLNPMLRAIFGEAFAIERHVEKVVIVVVFLSILPGILVWLRNKLRKPQTPIQENEPVAV